MAIRSLCLLLGRAQLRDWLEDALVRLETDTDASVDLIVRTNTDESDAQQSSTHRFDAEVLHTKPELVDGGPRVRLPDETVDYIARTTDAVLQNGVGILTGRILTAPEHGVLSYHHGNIREYRGIVTHFWNFLNQDDEGGVTLLQLDESLDAGAIAAERTVDLSDALTWAEVEHRKHRAGVPLLADAVRNFEQPDFEPVHVPEDKLGQLYTSSDITALTIATYLALETTRTVRGRLRKLRYLLRLRS